MPNRLSIGDQAVQRVVAGPLLHGADNWHLGQDPEHFGNLRKQYGDNRRHRCGASSGHLLFRPRDGEVPVEQRPSGEQHQQRKGGDEAEQRKAAMQGREEACEKDE